MDCWDVLTMVHGDPFCHEGGRYPWLPPECAYFLPRSRNSFRARALLRSTSLAA